MVVHPFLGSGGHPPPPVGHRRPADLDIGARPNQRSDDVKYVVLIYSNPAAWQALPKQEADRVIGDHFVVIEELTRSGELLSQFGLADASNAKTLRVDAGASVVTDGPFSEAKEQLAGVFLVDCESVDRVLEFSATLAQHAVVEVRPLMVEAGTEM
jgi:hypothetical protein